MKKKIVITGGSGFIGSYLIKKFLSKNCKVLNIDKLSAESQNLLIKNRNYKFKKCDLLNFRKLFKILDIFGPDTIINAAAESHVDRSIHLPKFFFENNLISTLNLLEFVRQSKKKVNFIHISTDEVFGSLDYKEKKFSIISKYNPRSPYSASKAASDHAVRSYGETFGISFNITNCSNNFGPYQYPEKLIPLVITKCIQRMKIPIYGNGKNIRDWIHVKDHVNAIYEIYKRGKNGKTYLIGSDYELTNLEITRKICEIFDDLYKTKNSKNLIKFVKDRKGHDFRYAIDNSLIFKELKWKPTMDFETGLRDTIKFYYKNFKNLKKIFTYG